MLQNLPIHSIRSTAKREIQQEANTDTYKKREKFLKIKNFFFKINFITSKTYQIQNSKAKRLFSSLFIASSFAFFSALGILNRNLTGFLQDKSKRVNLSFFKEVFERL
jgi:hypothetical protein